jgi:hypothetical protein
MEKHKVIGKKKNHFNLLIKIARKKNIDPKNWLKFTHTLKSMYNGVNTYMERDIEWKNKMIINEILFIRIDRSPF